MSRARPEPGCIVVSFAEPYPMDDASEVALEDYARVLARARSAEAVRAEAADAVAGVHLCGAGKPPSPPVLADLEGFARSLSGGPSGGLGWS
jgi:hypothetical protein